MQFFRIVETDFEIASFRWIETDFLLSVLLFRANFVLGETIIQNKVEPTSLLFETIFYKFF